MDELTRLLDVITPEIYLAYMNNFTKEKSALITSGVAVANAQVSANINSGGKIVHMPFWEDLNGEEEILGDGDKALTTGKITASQDQAAVLYRGKGWAVNELAAVISGDRPMEALLSKIASWWLRREQHTLVHGVLAGLFGKVTIDIPDEDETPVPTEFIGPLANSHMNDQSTKAISNDIILDSKQLLGDASDQLSLLLMHSKIYTSLQKLGLVEYLPDVKGHPTIPSYLGYRVVVDDGCPVDKTDPAKPVYTTFLFRTGSIGRNSGHPSQLTLWETARDAKRGNDEVYTRRALTLHPFGIKYNNMYFDDPTNVTPSNKDLADPRNWNKVYEDKQIGIIAIKSLAV